MSIRRNHLNLLLVAILIFTAGIAGVVEAKEVLVNPFADEVDYLTLLNLWPNANWDPARPIAYQEYITLLEKLCNGRSDTPLTSLAEKVNAPGIPTTYRDALTIAGIFLGYDKNDSYTKMKALTTELKKSDTAQITGYDMAYIFHTMLYSKRVGQEKTLLEERYLVGNNPVTISRVMQITENQIVLEDEGTLPLAKDAAVFWVRDGRVSPLSYSRVAVGMANLRLFFNARGEVYTIVMTNKYYPDSIRVLLSVELNQVGSSASYDFAEVQVTATQPFKIVAREGGKNQTILVAETGEVITFVNRENGIELSTGKFKTTIKNRVYLQSYLWHNISFDPLINTPRNGKVPVYVGTLEIFPAKKAGYLNMVNELPIEMYLRKVVAAQVPASWGKEAAKVQAIAARSYAIAQVTHGKFSSRGANVDDSNATQIYNNNAENPLINEAIAETEGMVITNNGNIIDAVFFSTSAGLTANSEEVWHNERTKEFPGIPVTYLRSTSLITKGSVPDFSNEANALAFFRSAAYKSYDSNAPLYRWKVILSRTELENTINKGLVEREKADLVLGTDFVQTLQGLPIDPQNPNFSIGTLKDLKVALRGEGGNIMVLDIVGTNGTYRVKKEYNIRFVIRPAKEFTGSASDVLLYLNDGTSLKNYSLLPSTFAAFDITRNMQAGIDKVTIYGGGAGHGVGLSQWGVRGMAEQGMNVEQIIKFFYSGTKIEKVY